MSLALACADNKNALPVKQMKIVMVHLSVKSGV